MARSDRLRLDDQLCFALYAATHAIQRAYRPLLGELGLTYPQYLVLLALWQEGDQTIGELAARLALPAHGVGPVVDRLQRVGLVVSERTPPDRRVRRIHLTEAGVAMERAAASAQWKVECRTGLERHDLEELRDELQELVGRMASVAPLTAVDSPDASLTHTTDTTQGVNA